MHQFFQSLISFSLIFTLFVSCSKKEAQDTFNNSEVPRLVNSKLISDRGIDYDQGVVILRLKRAPLLVTSTKDINGKIIIDENEKEAIILEQAQMLERLKKISPQIKLIYSYKLTLNGMAVAIPAELYGEVLSVEGVSSTQKREMFAQVEVKEESSQANQELKNAFAYTTADFIGARKSGLTGKGVKVAIFDTGIDYTHKMFGGPGSSAIYKTIDPTKENNYFPNNKVVGGIDLVGEKFRPWSLRGNAVPQIDNNPIDTRGHGSHVAGTTAGIGDGVHTFDGIAPEADLYSIKVFARGGTGDDIVIAGIEWCLDPNGDYDLSDRIHIANMSLGGDYGRSYDYYNESVSNAAIADFIVVAAAGNAGAIPYIIGSPSTVSAATAVGATIGGMDYLWKTDKVAKLSSNNLEDIIVELIEGEISKPVGTIGQLTGELVYVGSANESISIELKEKVKGKIALVDRGGANFIVKLNNVKAAGAIAAVVVNNAAGDAIMMGGGGKVNIPAIMVTMDVGNVIKKQLANNEAVTIVFNSDDILEKPYLVDRITRFSSQGPTVDNAAFKPEVMAPGYQVISARRGSGDKASRLNGTSMAAPQVAGAYALLRQAFPKRSSKSLKAMMVGSSQVISDKKVQEKYLLSRQGAGRIQVDKALSMNVIASPETVSLGFIEVNTQRVYKKSLKLINLSNDDAVYSVRYQSMSNVAISGPSQVSVKANESVHFDYELVISGDQSQKGSYELNADIQFLSGDDVVFHTPILGIARSLTSTSISSLDVEAERSPASSGARSELTINNTSNHNAIAEVFNLVAFDDKKPQVPGLGVFKTRECDLQALGQRIVKKDGKEFIQFGIKIYNPTSIWNICEVSVLFDTNDDDIADFELGGVRATSVSGLSDFVSTPNSFVSALVDANGARNIRMAYEAATRKGEGFSLNYKKVILGTSDMTTYSQSTVAVIEYDKSLINIRNDGKLKIKVASLAGNGSDIDSDDYLGIDDKWHLIEANEEEMAFRELPTSLAIAPLSQTRVEMIKGKGAGDLVAFIPTNESVMVNETKSDRQIFVLTPNFLD